MYVCKNATQDKSFEEYIINTTKGIMIETN